MGDMKEVGRVGNQGARLLRGRSTTLALAIGLVVVNGRCARVPGSTPT